jgi:hypothetical protein
MVKCLRAALLYGTQCTLAAAQAMAVFTETQKQRRDCLVFTL